MKKAPTGGPSMLVGWREWVSLPELSVDRIKAKIDTGARTSSIHAFDVELKKKAGHPWVEFTLHPLQRGRGPSVRCEAPLVEERWVKSSNGQRDFRPVIETTLSFGRMQWPIELTLTSRDEMGFRMLLGREALRRRCLIDPSRSFVFRDLVPKKKKKQSKK